MPDDSTKNIETLLYELSTNYAVLSDKVSGALKRIDEQSKLVESLRDIASSVKILTAQMEITNKKVDDLSDDMGELKQKPIKRWDGAVTTIITVILSGFIGYILSRIGMQ